MNTPTPTPRTDAATYPADCLGQTLVTNRDCPCALERELTAITAERDQLRAIFPQICAAFGNGAFCTPTVSVGFIESIPNEVELVIAELRARAERAEAEVERLKTCGITELAAVNPSVLDYCKHWEARAQRAEAFLRTLGKWEGAK